MKKEIIQKIDDAINLIKEIIESKKDAKFNHWNSQLFLAKKQGELKAFEYVKKLIEKYD